MKTLILLTVIAVTFAEQPVCGENQRYKECGSACPLTCENYANAPKMCPAMCVSGCHCEVGYVKTKDGRCVRPENCPSNAPFPTWTTCTEERESGRCLASIPAWYYSIRTGVCTKFIYGGCGGNGNRYETAEECMKKCAGNCVENQEFGCGTTCPLTCDNLNDPPKICNRMCVYGCHCKKGYVKTIDGTCVLPEQCPISAPLTLKTCDEKPKSGRCIAYFPSWYYDTETGTCKEFIYGGCEGNGNRYSTEEECLGNCKGVQQKTRAEACNLPAETGVCRGFFPRFYFDRTTGECQKFVYGGCGGNENNFESIEDCQTSCARRAAPTACLEKKVVGRCYAAFVRYFFNSETGKCEEFIYGGCEGNSNNFHSAEECEAVCAA